MSVNGATTLNQSFWCQTVSTEPNTDYVFSTWLASINTNSPAVLQFSINGVNLGTTFNATNINCDWREFYQIWNSGIATSANICIVNQNSIAVGNDFALDDIYFAPLCSKSDTIHVTYTTPPTLASPSIQQLCFEDQTQVQLLNNVDVVSYLYAISHQSNPSLPLAISSNFNETIQLPFPGEYYYLCEIDYGCFKDTILDTFNITQVAPLFLGNDTLFCLGETMTIDISSGNYDSIRWNDGTTNNTFTINASGIYFCDVYAFGDDTCHTSDTIYVFVPVDSVKINVSISDLLCFQDNTGEISVAASGSVGRGYEYQLDANGFQNTNSIFTGLSSGNYTISVRDSLGCVNDTIVSINEPQLLQISNLPVKNVRCAGLTDGKIAVTANGGTRPFSFDLSGNPPSIADSIFDQLPAGIYTAKVTDNHGCEHEIGVGVTEPSPIILSTNTIDTCIFPSVNLTTSVSGGSIIPNSDYNYYWNHTIGISTLNTTPLQDTIITVFATDDSLCSSDTLTIAINLIPQMDFSVDLQDSCQPHSVIFTSQFLNNFNPSNCTWTLGNGDVNDNCNSFNYTYFDPGNYTVTYSITTDKGCSNLISKADFIEVYPNPIPNFSHSPEFRNILNPIF